MSGKRESKTSRTRRKSSGGLSGWWRQHRAWVSGLDRGQKTRYRLFQFLVVLAVLAIAVCLAARAWITLPTVPNLPSGTVTTEEGDMTFDGAELPNVAKSGRKDGVYTFLLVGQDTGGGGNTDTMLLVTFDSVNKEVHGMSLPRDTMINSSHSGAGHRLNAVYNYNKGSDPDTQMEKGITALKREVGKLTGIIPDFYVVVQWEAVGELVDAIGGVDYDVPIDMYYYDPSQGLNISIPAGMQHLDGETAVKVVRFRSGYPTADIGRIGTQQDFLMSVAGQMLTLGNIPNLPTFIDIFEKYVTTNLSAANISFFARQFLMCKSEDINFHTAPGNGGDSVKGNSYYALYVDEWLEMVNECLNPYDQPVTTANVNILTHSYSSGFYSTTGVIAGGADSFAANPSWSASTSSDSGGEDSAG